VSVTVDEAIAAYRAACERSNEIARGVPSLDDPCKARHPEYTVRWVMLHMIEETARHAGHADITRELIDGAVGIRGTSATECDVAHTVICVLRRR